MLSRTRFLGACATLLLSSFAYSNTWIVDDDGGVGVQFTELQPAIDVAVPGDVILVRAGVYSPFTLYRGVVVIGEPGVRVTGLVSISLVPAGQRAALVEFDVEQLGVDRCLGRVVLEDVRSDGPFVVRASPDVRARDLAARPTSSDPLDAVTVDGARLELVDAVAQASGTTLALPGGAGLYANGAARAHVVAGSFAAGAGGLAAAPFDIAPNGGPGAAIELGSLVIATGGANFTGGAGGTNPAQPSTCAYDGFGGYGAEGLGALTLSASTVLGGSYDQSLHCSGISSAPSFAPGLSVTTVSVPEPTLGVSGPTFAGTTVALTLTGEPGSSATLYLGRKLVVGASGGAWIEQLVSHERTIPLGAFPASGVLTRNFAIPAAYGSGFLFGAQAEVQSSIGLQRTNSLPIVVR
jgi:hypothetical protein